METPNLTLTMVRSSGDLPLRTKIFQLELRDFLQALEASGFKVGTTIDVIEAEAGLELPTFLGQFAIKLAKNPLVGGAASAVVGFLDARYGRKVRLKVGDIEVEAQTETQVRNLLKKAEEVQQRNGTKSTGES
jgi:hypothetical protein